MFYTLGQRQGLNLGNASTSANQPWYVVDKDITRNVLIVAEGCEHPMLYSQALICSAIHWLNPPNNDSFPRPCYAKTRYRQTEQACIISPHDEHEHTVLFSSPQRAVTPGQYVVFYAKNECLGGAVIEKIIR